MSRNGGGFWVAPSVDNVHEVLRVHGDSDFPEGISQVSLYLEDDAKQTNLKVAVSTEPAVCRWIASPEGLAALVQTHESNKTLALVMAEFDALIKSASPADQVVLASDLWVEASTLRETARPSSNG